MKIAIIGCGGIGTHLALPLLKYSEHLHKQRMNGYRNRILRIKLIDGDKFEESNMDRQLINPSSIGANKARWLGGLLNLFKDKDTQLDIIEEYITDDNINTYLSTTDIIFNCVDNNATRLLIENFRNPYTTIFNGGNELHDGNVYTSTSKNQSILDIHKEIVNPTDKNPGLSCQAAIESTPQISITNNMVAALMLVQFYKHMNKCEMGEDKTELYFDIRDGRVQGYDRRLENDN